MAKLPHIHKPYGSILTKRPHDCHIPQKNALGVPNKFAQLDQEAHHCDAAPRKRENNSPSENRSSFAIVKNRRGAGFEIRQSVPWLVSDGVGEEDVNVLLAIVRARLAAKKSRSSFAKEKVWNFTGALSFDQISRRTTPTC